MHKRFQIYYCEVGPCAFCGKPIYRGSRLFENKQGTQFCSLDCAMSLEYLQGIRAGVIKSRYENWKVTHNKEVSHV